MLFRLPTAGQAGSAVRFRGVRPDSGRIPGRSGVSVRRTPPTRRRPDPSSCRRISKMEAKDVRHADPLTASDRARALLVGPDRRARREWSVPPRLRRRERRGREHARLVEFGDQSARSTPGRKAGSPATGEEGRSDPTRPGHARREQRQLRLRGRAPQRCRGPGADPPI